MGHPVRSLIFVLKKSICDGYFAAMVSKLFGLLSTNDEKAMEQKKRFFEIAGCTFPEDWDQLSLEEKRSRISKAEDFGIKD